MLPLVSTIPLGTSFTALKLGEQCGTKICEIDEYCSKFHNQCESCEEHCDEKHYNFDLQLCITDCKNYLRDRNFVKLSDYAAEVNSLKTHLAAIYVLLGILAVFVFAVNALKIFKYCKRSWESLKKTEKKEKPVEPMTMANPHTVSPKMRPKLQTHQNNHNALNRTSSIFTVSGTEFDNKTVSTPISTRHPAEDTLTSSATTNYSYDNQGLQLTPVNEKPKIETTF